MRLAICIPSTEMLHADFCISLCGLISYIHSHPLDKDFEYTVFNIRGSLVQHSRDELIKMALDDGSTHILFLDSDMKWNADTLHMLMSHDLPVVACNYVKRTLPATSNTRDLNGQEVFTYDASSGLEEVESAGFGFTLIKREVFEEVPWPWFDCVWLDNKSLIGEDVFFYKKLRHHGFKLMIDHDASQDLAHLGGFEYINSLAMLHHEKTGTDG